MKNILLLNVVTILLAPCFGQDNHNTLTKKEKKEGWELLFDGKTTNGWRNIGKETITGWKVIDGVLHNSGIGSDYGGDIISVEEYENFELYVEWKATKHSNSGIFYRVNEEASKVIFFTGPEYQLLDDNGWPSKLKPSQYSGANYDMNTPENAKVNPLDEFNETRIVVNGAHVEHWLNGVKVVEYELWSDDWKNNKENSKWKDKPHYGMAKKGHVGFQDHGGLTMFRNIKIRKL